MGIHKVHPVEHTSFHSLQDLAIHFQPDCSILPKQPTLLDQQCLFFQSNHSSVCWLRLEHSTPRMHNWDPRLKRSKDTLVSPPIQPSMLHRHTQREDMAKASRTSTLDILCIFHRQPRHCSPSGLRLMRRGKKPFEDAMCRCANWVSR